MNADDIRPLLAADPFERFFLNLSDGSSFEVSDPGQVVFPSAATLQYMTKGRRVLIALTHVVSIGFPSSTGDPFFLRGK